MNVVAYIQSVAALLDPVPFFISCPMDETNARLDDADITNGFVNLVRPLNGVLKKRSSGVLSAEYDLLVQFGEKCKEDASAEETEIIFYRQWAVMLKFLHKIRNDNSNVETFSDLVFKEIPKGRFDTTSMGIAINFTLTLRNRDQNICGV